MGEPSLVDRLARAKAGAAPRPSPRRGVLVGIVAMLGLVVAKAKAFGLVALKFATTGWTMLLSAWVYSVQVGWPFAALLVGLILLHEIGHGVAARRIGIRIGVPVFIPFFGAMIAIRDRPRDRWEDFVVAAGGPLIGGMASVACLASSALLDGGAQRLLHGAGFFALFLNLYNLLPVWIFDGAKMLPLVRGRDGLIGLAIAGGVTIASGLWASHVNGMAVIVLVVVAWQVAMASRAVRGAPETLLERLQPSAGGPSSPAPEQVPSRQRRIAAVAYFGMLALYASLVQLTDVAGAAEPSPARSARRVECSGWAAGGAADAPRTPGASERSLGHGRSVPWCLVLVTYNLNYANPNFAATLDAIEAADADLVLLQEVTEEWRDALTRRFATRYPHRKFHLHTRLAGGLGVLSRLDLAHAELWAAPEGTGAWYPAERLVVETAHGALQLLHVHLRPALDRGSWLRGFLTTPEVRRAEIAAHWHKLDRSLPTIVAGDFNEDPTGLAISFLTDQGLTRVETAGPRTWRYEARSGGRSYDILKMDIDHVLIDHRLVARDAHVREAGASDHRPVVVTITRP